MWVKTCQLQDEKKILDFKWQSSVVAVLLLISLLKDARRIVSIAGRTVGEPRTMV